jgi:flagellar FliL protein
MAEEEKEKGEASKKGGKKKLLLLVLIGILVIGIAGGVVFFFSSKGKKEGEGEGEKKAQHKKEEKGVIIDLEPVVVNLLDPSGKRYIQVKFALEVPDKKAEEAIKEDLPRIKDVIISYLSAKTPEEALQPETKEEIKKTLLKKINEVLGEDLVMEVYITQYIVE